VEDLGLDIAAMDSDVAARLGLEGTEGVVITSVQDGSPADRAGLSPGMVIVQVGQKKVTSVDEFQAAIDQRNDDGPRGILLMVRSDKGSRFVLVKP
jgi:serine protease Do